MNTNANGITTIESLQVQENIIKEEIKSLELKLESVRSKLDVLRKIEVERK